MYIYIYIYIEREIHIYIHNYLSTDCSATLFASTPILSALRAVAAGSRGFARIRPISLLTLWISEGLTPAQS